MAHFSISPHRDGGYAGAILYEKNSYPSDNLVVSDVVNKKSETHNAIQMVSTTTMTGIVTFSGNHFSI